MTTKEEKIARNEVVLLARGFSMKNAFSKEKREKNPRLLPKSPIRFHRKELLDVFDNKGILYSIVHADFYCLGEVPPMYGKKKEYTYNPFEFALTQTRKDKKAPKSVEFRYEHGRVIGKYKISGLVPRIFQEELERIPLQDLDEKTRDIKKFELDICDKYFGGKVRDYNEYAYRLAILLRLMGINKTPKKAVKECLKNLGYDSSVDKYGNINWLEQPKNITHDSRLRLTISIAPEVFGYVGEKGYKGNLTKYTKKCSNLCLQDSFPWDVKQSDLKLEERTANLCFDFGDGRFLKEPIKARNILRMIAEYIIFLK